MNESYQPDTPLNELWQRYINENPRARSPHTSVLMRISVQNFQAFLGSVGVLADFTNENLVAYMEHRKQLGRSPRTIEREVSKLATMWRWAGQNGLCAIPRFSVQKCAPPTPTAWSPDELEKIFAGAAVYKSSICKLPANLVLAALLRLAYDTGERKTAIFSVKWSDIDLSGRWITYRGETRKGGASAPDNNQRISRQTIKALKALLEHYKAIDWIDDRVFPAMHHSTYYGHFRAVLKNCGLPAGRSCMFHKLRRTHATHLHVMGGDATASLGHSSDVMTRGYYLDPRQTRGGYLVDLNSGIMSRIRRLGRRLKRAFGLL